MFLLALLLSNLWSSSYSFGPDDLQNLLSIPLPYLSLDGIEGLSTNRCIPELGCFQRDGDFFHPLYRPISVVPEDRSRINTRFLLFTRSNPDQFQNITANVDVIRNSNFNPRFKTVLLIHGYKFHIFLGKYQADNFRKLRLVILNQEDTNVIFVNWGKGSTTTYFQATANSRVVGAEIALLINTMIKFFGARAENFHIIGHSLGAHIGGYAGQRIKNLGRITGLDPANPYFFQMPVNVRLDITDANFVDIIHTNAPNNVSSFHGLGYHDLIGHVDYYPNEGNNQPGCSNEITEALSEGLSYAIRKLTVCSHARSIEFLIEAFESTRCPLMAFRCDNFQNFKLGKCYLCGPNGDNCKLLGIDYHHHDYSSPKREGFYFLTNDKFPFCAFHFRIEVHLGRVPQSVLNTPLFFQARIHNGNYQVQGESPVMFVSDNQVLSFIIIGSDEMASLGALELRCYKCKLSFDDLQISELLEVIHAKVTPMSYLMDESKLRLERIYKIGLITVFMQPETTSLSL